MAVSVKSIALWRKEVENRPGALADTLGPLARAGADLKVVMAYRLPGRETQAVVELYPVSGKKALAAAQAAGLTSSSIPTLLVEGDDRPGLGQATARAMADAGINISFLVTLVIGRKYLSVIGFESEVDAKKATTLLKKLRGAPPATARRTGR